MAYPKTGCGRKGSTPSLKINSRRFDSKRLLSIVVGLGSSPNLNINGRGFFSQRLPALEKFIAGSIPSDSKFENVGRGFNSQRQHLLPIVTSDSQFEKVVRGLNSQSQNLLPILTSE
jgi:hypothetical protein